MSVLIASALLSLVVLPLAALYWLTQRSRSLVGWGLKALAVGGYVWATFGLGGWQMLSYYGRYVLLLLFAGAALLGAWRMTGAPVWSTPRGRQWIGHGVAALLLVASGWALVGMYRGYEVPPDPVTLSSPLRDGTFYVASGGSHSLVNPHMKVAAPDLRDWRGQLWAVDFVELYPFGNRARGLFPTTLSDFAIYDTPVYAPCDGRVEAVTDTLRPRPPGAGHRSQGRELRPSPVRAGGVRDARPPEAGERGRRARRLGHNRGPARGDWQQGQQLGAAPSPQRPARTRGAYRPGRRPAPDGPRRAVPRPQRRDSA